MRSRRSRIGKSFAVPFASYKEDGFPVDSQGDRARAPNEHSELYAIQLRS